MAVFRQSSAIAIVIQITMASAIGNAVPLERLLTAPEMMAEISICMLPINAEAVPANFLKGASARAVVFGTSGPRLAMNPNINIEKSSTLVVPDRLAITSPTPINVARVPATEMTR